MLPLSKLIPTSLRRGARGAACGRKPAQQARRARGRPAAPHEDGPGQDRGQSAAHATSQQGYMPRFVYLYEYALYLCIFTFISICLDFYILLSLSFSLKTTCLDCDIRPA